MDQLLEKKLASRKRAVRFRFINRARDFLKQIGIPIVEVPSYVPDPAESFFKGCWWEGGELYYCPARVDVGEWLHEAGHGALLPKDQWHLLTPGTFVDVYPPIGCLKHFGDFAVEAWDYAAAAACDIPSIAVFENGFDGKGMETWNVFYHEAHPGFPILQLLGMSSQYGTCDRWLIGNACLSEDMEETTHLFMRACTKKQRECFEASARRMVEK